MPRRKSERQAVGQRGWLEVFVVLHEWTWSTLFSRNTKYKTVLWLFRSAWLLTTNLTKLYWNIWRDCWVPCTTQKVSSDPQTSGSLLSGGLLTFGYVGLYINQEKRTWEPPIPVLSWVKVFQTKLIQPSIHWLFSWNWFNQWSALMLVVLMLGLMSS